MHASSASRKRTRREWDDYYRNLYNEAKEKKGTGGNASAGVARNAKNVVDSESAVVDGSVASEVRAPRENKKFDLGKEVVSDVSSLKTGLESGSGSGSNVGNLDGWDGSGAPATISDSVSDSGNSSSSIDGSDESEAEADGISDEDYEVNEQSSSDDYDDDGSDYEKEETEAEVEVEDESDSAVKAETDDDGAGCGDEKVEFPSASQSTGIFGKIETYGKIESDEDEGCQEGRDNVCHNRERGFMKEEDVEIISEDEIHGVDRNASIDKKAEDKLDGFGRIYEPCSSNDHVVKTSNVEDSSEFWRIVNIREDVGIDESKRGKILGLDNADKRSVREDTNVASQRHPHTEFKFPKKEPETEDVNSPVPEICEIIPSHGLKYKSNPCVDKASKAGDDTEFWTIVSVRNDVNSLKGRKSLGLDNADARDVKEDMELASQLLPRTNLKFQKNEPDAGDFGSSLPKVGDFFPSRGRKNKTPQDGDDICIEGELLSVHNYLKVKFCQKTRAQKSSDLTKILVESICSLKKEQYPIQDDDSLNHESPPLRFRFEDDVQAPPAKSEWEKEMDSLFSDLELGLRESDIEFMSSSVTDNDERDSTQSDGNPAGFCGPGKHQLILDEQIGIVCKYCGAVILDIKYVLPDFHTPRLGKRNRVNLDDSPNHVVDDQIWFRDSAARNPSSSKPAKGRTVWDLIAGLEKEMYPHQRQGFEFMWRNLAGDIRIDKLKQPLSGEGRGCIISHTPGSGKTRLTIMFLLSFLKLYPTCRPVIIAPRGILATWQQEFIKWRVDIPFHNLNKMKLCGDENAIASNMTAQVGAGSMNKDHIRLVKLCAWMRGRRILGMSYQLFEKLSAENGKGQMPEVRKILLEMPGLLVLDEGHTPRNDQSRLWNSLMEVATRRRIILSGTPFQNNLDELHNTLCLVNPEFVDQIGPEYDTIRYGARGRLSNNMNKKRWAQLTCSIEQNMDRLMMLKRLLDPFIHVYKGSILEEQLPGLSECLVFLQPTELQKILLEAANKAEFFDRIQLVSLISVHPSLILMRRNFLSLSLPVQRGHLEEIESNIDAGVKTKFVMSLILLADALGERVLIFSQFINPLVFIKKQIISHYSWIEGKEVLYMDGQFDEKQRQESISSFNDETSEAKVLLASERACSEGISLVGASRVVLLDTVWNPSVEKQAVSRAYRLGQKKFVYVYRLFTSGVEVRKYAQQIKKERISELIVSPLIEEHCQHDWLPVREDKVLDSMIGLDCIEKIITQPKKSDLIEIFGLMDQQ